jgi:hypothetical protein
MIGMVFVDKRVQAEAREKERGGKRDREGHRHRDPKKRKGR